MMIAASTRRFRPLALLAAVSLGFVAGFGPSACGSDDDDTGSTPTKGGGGTSNGGGGKGGNSGGGQHQDGGPTGGTGGAGQGGGGSSGEGPQVTFTEGTNLSATVSPDGKQIIMDVQGALWSLPAAGGAARRVTDPYAEAARPHWSPAGDLVAFHAFAGGTYHVWVMKPDGTGLRQVTSGHGDDREPRFSPDGKTIAFSSDRAFNGSYDIWTVPVAGGTPTPWTTAAATDEYEPDWVPGGTEIAYAVGVGTAAASIQATNAQGTTRTLVTAPAGMKVVAPAVSPDGTRVAYVQQPAGATAPSALMVSGVEPGATATPVGASADAFPFPAAWLGNDELLYAADGKLRATTLTTPATRDIAFEATAQFAPPAPYARKAFDFDATAPRQAKGIVGPKLSPDGTKVVFEALNQIWVMTIGQAPVALTNDLYYKIDPSWSPDSKQVAFSSDKAGSQDLYVVTVATGAEQRVTSLPGAEIGSSWSPDGTKLAFQSEASASTFTTETFTVEIATGNVTKVIGPLNAPSRPSWHPSGQSIAVCALKPYSRRFREGTNQILRVNLADGALSYSEPAPFKSISTRGEDGPFYAPDGSAIAFVMESALWTMPVDAQGAPSGPATLVTSEAADSPSWSGDSQTLLYLSNGVLRRVPRTGGAPVTVPLSLTWQPEMPAGRTIIHAGKLWDGRGASLLTDVDVVVEGHRITQVRAHDANAPDVQGATLIDATDRTVIPGLWESHTHQYVNGRALGDRLGRLWMAYGFTSLGSLADAAYHAVETREAYASGRRVGPRFFATGEGLDGERAFVNLIRPITGGDEQIARELSRAKALEYDRVKTYIRLDHVAAAKITEQVHKEMGVFVTSHNIPPLGAYYQDGVAHVSAASRSGTAYTRSGGGVSYQDALEAVRRHGMFTVTVTFAPSLYRDDPTMVEDQRFVTLNPPGEQASLVGKRNFAVNGDQTALLDRLTKEETTVKALLDAGLPVLAGTDSPFDNVAAALHLNLRAQVKQVGLPPWRAMQTATKLAAEVAGVGEHLGTIEVGKLADLVFIDGNPLTEIKDLDNVTDVVKNGRRYTIEELMAPFQPAVLAAAPRAPKNRVLPTPPQVEAAAQKYWWHDPARMGHDD
jgi:Tol biopolymer transport system component/imidazolonepropionase-like amidohydrolase